MTRGSETGPTRTERTDDGAAVPPLEPVRLRAEAVSWREIDGEVVVLDLERSEYLSVNESGTVLWTLLAEGTTRDALVEALIARFGVDQPRATADVDAFLARARERRLLEG